MRITKNNNKNSILEEKIFISTTQSTWQALNASEKSLLTFLFCSKNSNNFPF